MADSVIHFLSHIPYLISPLVLTSLVSMLRGMRFDVMLIIGQTILIFLVRVNIAPTPSLLRQQCELVPPNLT